MAVSSSNWVGCSPGGACSATPSTSSARAAKRRRPAALHRGRSARPSGPDAAWRAGRSGVPPLGPSSPSGRQPSPCHWCRRRGPRRARDAGRPAGRATTGSAPGRARSRTFPPLPDAPSSRRWARPPDRRRRWSLPRSRCQPRPPGPGGGHGLVLARPVQRAAQDIHPHPLALLGVGDALDRPVAVQAAGLMGEDRLQFLVLKDGRRLEARRFRGSRDPSLDVEDPAALVVEAGDRMQLQALDRRQQSDSRSSQAA
jgi:hypothetical protein